MANFYITPESISGNIARITGEEAVHISRVLRSKVGDRVILCDGRGTFYDAEFIEFSKSGVTAKILSEAPADTEPNVKITLYQCVPKNPKLETIVQKATEIGVCAVVPVHGARCVAKIEKEEKLVRLRRIATEAAKQSKRGIIPKIAAPVSFEEAIKRASAADLAIIPYENERTRPLKEALRTKKPETVSIIIGPEGGFEEAEISAAAAQGITAVTLGRRILRTETASPVVCAAVLYEYDEME